MRVGCLIKTCPHCIQIAVPRDNGNAVSFVCKTGYDKTLKDYLSNVTTIYQAIHRYAAVDGFIKDNIVRLSKISTHR